MFYRKVMPFYLGLEMLVLRICSTLVGSALGDYTQTFGVGIKIANGA